MSGLLPGAGEVAVVVTLAVSGGSHLARPAHHADALAAHGLGLRPAAARRAVTGLGAVEVAIPAAALAGAILGAGALRRGAGGAALALFAALAVYGLWVLRRLPRGAAVACGCGIGEHRLGAPTVARAAVLAGAAALSLGPAGTAPEPLALVAGLTYAVLLALVPPALDAPGPAPAGGSPIGAAGAARPGAEPQEGGT